MPQGIVVDVDNGFATLDFVDEKLRGPALVKLLDIGGPETIQTVSRRGPRRQYVVPEGNAREAGLIDGARGLNADGTQITTDFTGAGGFPDQTTTTKDVATGDTGWAVALENADPNDGSSVIGADGPASTGTVNWHTPTAEYTARNAFDGKVPNADVLHNRSQVFTGLGTSVGGDLAHPMSHADLIAYVKASSDTFQRTAGTREPLTPAAVVSNALASQPGALASDPGGDAPQPDSPVTRAKLKGPKKAAKASAAPSAALTPPVAAPAVPAPQNEPPSPTEKHEGAGLI